MQNLDKLKAKYVAAKKEYYNSGNTTLTDAEFDAIEEKLQRLAPNWEGLKKTGVSVGKKQEVALEAPMPSLDKMTGDNAEGVERFLAKNSPVIIMPKFDGSAIQVVYVNGKARKLMTRGDGVTGKDISFFLPFVRNLPKEVPVTGKLVVRLEAIYDQKTYQAKYAGEYDSDRALASAVLNRRDVSPALKDLRFIALRNLTSKLELSAQLKALKAMGFETAPFVKRASTSCEELTEMTVDAKQQSKYILDGLVVASNASNLPITADRPSYARAFKLNEMADAQETVVEKIVWKVSPFGVIVPKAIIRPVKFGQVTVKQAAVHNAKWARERGVGVGAKVKVLRSGDIIPKIVEVTKKAKFTLPSKIEFGEYEWDDTGTAIRLTASSKKESEVYGKARIARFFASLGIDNFGGALAAKLYNAGYVKTENLVGLTALDFGKLPGIKSSALKLSKAVSGIRKGEYDIVRLMVASGVFDKGLGKTLLYRLYEEHPEVFKPTAKFVESKAGSCIGPVAASNFAKNHAKFFKWLEVSGAKFCKVEKVKTVDGPLKGVYGSWTGYRNKQEEEMFTSLGGTVQSFKASTSVLFYKVDGKASSKVAAAEQRGCQVVSNFGAYIKKLK